MTVKLQLPEEDLKQGIYSPSLHCYLPEPPRAAALCVQEQYKGKLHPVFCHFQQPPVFLIHLSYFSYLFPSSSVSMRQGL